MMKPSHFLFIAAGAVQISESVQQIGGISLPWNGQLFKFEASLPDPLNIGSFPMVSLLAIYLAGAGLAVKLLHH